MVLLIVLRGSGKLFYALSSNAATRIFLLRLDVAQGGNVVGAIDSAPTGGFRATITDASGREVLTFDLAASDRFILSSVDGKIANRKLNKDDHYWSRATLKSVISEMTSKN